MNQWLLFFFSRLNGIKDFTCNSGEVIFVKSWSISSRCVSPVYTRHHVSSTVSHSIILFQPVCQFTREEKAHNSIFFLKKSWFYSCSCGGKTFSTSVHRIYQQNKWTILHRNRKCRNRYIKCFIPTHLVILFSDTMIVPLRFEPMVVIFLLKA